MTDGGRFGRWSADDAGLPVFELAPPRARVELVTPAGGRAACWHAVGNAGIIATAHAGGWTTLYTATRGVVRLTGRQGSWGIAGAPTVVERVRFELGGATWRARAGPATMTRRIAAPSDGSAVLRIDVTIEGAAPGAVYEERWVLAPTPLLVGALMSGFEPPPPGYTETERVAWRALFGLSAVVRALTTATRRALGTTLFDPAVADPTRHAIVFPARRRIGQTPAESPAWFDRALPDLFVANLLSADGGAQPPRLVPTEGSIGVRLDAGRAELAFAVGLAGDDDDRDRLLERARDRAASSSAVWAGFAQLECPARPRLAREATWHAASLVAAEQHDDYFGRRYVAQGGAYGFVHGLQGAPRDYALFGVPMAYIDPVMAREQLEVVMRLTRPSGATHYAHTGRGRATSGGVHAAPTDLPLFFLWSLTEYVWSTGDRSFLDEEVPFYPASSASSATPRERAVLALHYLDERVGRGPHGMLRVGSGDWSDPISAMVPDRGAFHERGESGFNTAFAAYVLPRVAELLEPDAPAIADRASVLAAELRGAMEDAWTGRWFLRGWDGGGGPIGAEHLFLDGQVWALIAGIGTDAQRAELTRSIAERCDDPSPIGATILDRPHPVRLGMLAPGWDCNGGVWATINALLAWGYALHDPERAWRSLEKQSLGGHAAAYPDVWYGIWSGPDAYNAHFGSRPGETFVQPATPMREFPVMNANAHAGPLLALLRVLGIETEPSGIVVRDRVPGLEWTLTTPRGSFTPRGFVAAV